jgi:hypothetical protein
VEGMCQQSVGGDSPVEAVSHQMVAMTQANPRRFTNLRDNIFTYLHQIRLKYGGYTIMIGKYYTTVFLRSLRNAPEDGVLHCQMKCKMYQHQIKLSCPSICYDCVMLLIAFEK